MTLTLRPIDGQPRLAGGRVSTVAYFIVACALSAVTSVAAIAIPELSRWLLAMALLATLTVVSMWSPFATLILSVIYIVLQGLLRRLLPDVETRGLGDPLLLVLPVLAILLTAIHVRRSPLDLLAKVILAIQVAMAVSIINPLGSGIASGVAQFIVVALPFTWFWVTSRGVSIDAAKLRLFLFVIVVLGVAATTYGRFQVSFGFPSWDEAWIRDRGITSLQLGEFVRPFSSFTAAADYATFVGLSLMAAAALILSPTTRSLTVRIVLLTACGFFIHELIVLGSRGILLTNVLPVVVGLLIRTGLRLRFAIAVGIVGLVLLPTLLGSSSETAVTDATSTNSAALARQAQGLSDPFGEKSTLPGHIDRLVGGMTNGFESPLGHGVGVIGLSGSFNNGSAQADSGTSQGTETSYGDLGVSLGLVGTVLGFLFAGALLWRVGHQPRTRRDEAYWLLLFLAVLPLGPPLSAGSYATQVTYYALLGCAWTVLKQPTPGGESTDTEPQIDLSPKIAVLSPRHPGR